ncbi:DNA-directed RNA polymerase I subunit RPA1-like [Limulus polyphemus]|uniref:DNA-directed RNA polymerase n=1 Tax=Limulus polyphemus TaxID=6850 RepID=A0ABM1C2W5_LIMPO|nr:DNA-directed RNA polymerase I subunit RPA1-like [Limulus polyphemus]
MTSLIEEEAKKAVVQETPKINRAFLITDSSSGGQILKTEGVNLREMFNYDRILDLNKIYSNDIHAVASTYGIEAATRSIVKEITNVFAVYGIQVDPRHLLLIADYMTFDGTYKPCNRIGMESSASPLQQMTFETTMNFLKSATLSGFQDPLKSPSSRLVLGHLVAGGTGCFDLLQPRISLSKKSRK